MECFVKVPFLAWTANSVTHSRRIVSFHGAPLWALFERHDQQLSGMLTHLMLLVLVWSLPPYCNYHWKTQTITPAPGHTNFEFALHFVSRRSTGSGAGLVLDEGFWLNRWRVVPSFLLSFLFLKSVRLLTLHRITAVQRSWLWRYRCHIEGLLFSSSLHHQGLPVYSKTSFKCLLQPFDQQLHWPFT